MGIEGDGLVVGRTTDVLYTRLLINSIVVVQSNNDILAVISWPSRFKSCISIVKWSRISRSIVNTYQSVETQALSHWTEVNIHTCIELELTAGPCIIASTLHVSKDVGQVSLRTTQETSVDNVGRVGQHGQGSLCIGIDIAQGNEWTYTVWTQRCSCLPEISTIGTARIIIGSIGIDISSNEVVNLHIHITTNVETVGEIILCLSKLQEVALTIVAHVGIELGTLVTTFNLSSHVTTVISLLNELWRIEIHVRITIRILTASKVVDILCLIR